MQLFRCIFTNNEVFTTGFGGFKAELVDDLYYVVKGEIIKVDHSDAAANIGANKSAEDTSADADGDQPMLVPNLVTTLVNVSEYYSTKALYKDAMKKYLKKVYNHVEKEDPVYAKKLVGKMNEVMKSFLAKFDKLRFYATKDDEFDRDGAIIHYEQDDEEGEEVEGHECRIIIFKHGLCCESC